MNKNLLVLGAATLAAIGFGAINNEVEAATTSNATATTSLNVRSGAGTSYSKIGSLYPGQSISVISTSNGWSKINYNGKTGYVSSQYLRIGSTTTSNSNTTSGTYYTSATLNVRSGAGTNYPKIGSLIANKKVSVISSSNGWSKISYNGKTGYVSSQYLRTSSSTSSTPTTSNTSTSGSYYTTANLNVRSGAGTNYPKIGSLVANKKVSVISSSNGWSKISYNGIIGYVSSQYLSKTVSSGSGTSVATNVNANKKGLVTKANLLVINQGTMTISLYKNGIKTDSYSCATGKGGSTPAGVWSITNKIKNRPYYKKGIAGGAANNPLGPRWMQLSCGAAYGIHGTCYPWSMGSYASEGCVRMTNSTVELLYDKVPVGTTVIISPAYYNNNNKTLAASKGIYVNY